MFDKIFKWASDQVHSAKFWAFVGAVATIAGAYFTGISTPDDAIKALVAAVIAWLGLGLGDAARHSLLK